MSILLVGAHGNMGRRYSSILRHLNKEFVGIDKETDLDGLRDWAIKCKYVILATPTESHLEQIDRISTLGIPILCEKPFSKKMSDLDSVLADCKRYKTNLSMVFNYGFMPQTEVKDANQITSYNHFNSGKDGLVWDCIQLIGLAKGPIDLKNKSPLWEVSINGSKLNYADIPMSYVKCVASWLQKPGHDIDALFAIHKKTAAIEKSHRNATASFH